MKYFVKYKERVMITHNTSHLVDKTRFFNTPDIENEWNAFKDLCRSYVELVDITIIPTE